MNKPLSKTTNAHSSRKNEERNYEKPVSDYRPAGRDWGRGAMPLSDLLPRLMDPICARKGLASSALLAAWPELIGQRFCQHAFVEKINWPYKQRDGGPAFRAGTLVVRVDGPTGLYLQHDAPRIIERVNQFFGFVAIERVKIVQAAIQQKTRQKPKKPSELTARQEARLRECFDPFHDEALDAAVLAMGRAVLKRELSRRRQKN